MSPLVLGAALSALAGTVLGLLGGGGAVLTVPILVYVVGLEPRAAMATSLVVVGVTSAVAAATHARAGRVRFRQGLLFGGAGMAGAAAGASAGRDVPPTALLLLLSALMVAMALAMLRPRGGSPNAPGGSSRHPARALLAGLGVGTLTGLVGTGGGFMVVPALSLLGGFAMAEAVATSLFVISLNSASGLVAALASGTRVDPALAGGMALASVAGSLAGARLGRGLSADALRQAFSAFLALLGVAIALKELSPVAPPGPLAAGTAGVLGAVAYAAWRARRAGAAAPARS